MKLALVFDAPRATGTAFSGVGGAYLERTLAACAQAARVALSYEPFYAVAEAQPGGKAPPIAVVRDERERLFTELEAYEPDAVLSLGAGALNALAIDAPKALAISKERGRMRMLGETPWLPTISHLSVIKSSDLHRDLANDAYKVMAQPAPLPPMDIDLLIPDNVLELQNALDRLEGASAIGVDVETTGLQPYREELLAVGFGATYDDTSGVAVVIDRHLLQDPAVPDILWDATWRLGRRSVGHNFKFDMQFMVPMIDFPPDGALLGDTLLLGHLLDERPNRPTSRVRGLGLKDMVAVRYDVAYGFDFKEFYETPIDEQPPEAWDALHSYLGEDVVYTARLWHDLAREAEAESPNLIRAHDELLMPVSRAIARCELGGAPVNVGWIEETVRLFDRRVSRRQGAMERVLKTLTPREVDNINAPKQIADVMYDDWKMTPDVRKHGVKGKDDRSTDKDHIKAAVAKYLGTDLDRQARWLRSLIALRRDIKTRTTYQKSLLDRVDDDGRVRASFLIHGTSTGRLSSQGPNLQNVPAIDREDSSKFRPMRRAFQPKDGNLWVEVDYSQLELRVAAALSQDPDFMDVFRGGRDVHMEVATAIFSKPAEQIAKAERFLAKAVSFGIIYGRGPKALATGAEMRYAEQRLGMTPWTEDQAAVFIKKFLRSYPVLNQWMELLHEEVPVQGYVETPYGRRRRFPLYPKSRGELGSIQRQAVNTPVQSVASDICLEAMIRIQEGIAERHMPAQVLFTVHDSICIEVEATSVRDLRTLCRAEMQRDFMGVPLTVDFEAGPSWADVKEVS